MRSFGFHSRFMGIFWKRRSRRRLTNKEKSSSPQGLFDRKKSAPIIQGMVQGVLGGGENPFSPHDFFYFFYFLLSKFESGITRERFGIRRRHARKLLFSSLDFSQSSPIPSSAPRRLRPRRVWRSSLLTRIDSVSVFSVLAILDHWSKLWVRISPFTERGFRSNFQTSRGNFMLTS